MVGRLATSANVRERGSTPKPERDGPPTLRMFT